MHQNNRLRGVLDRRAEHFAGMNQTAVERTDADLVRSSQYPAVLFHLRGAEQFGTQRKLVVVVAGCSGSGAIGPATSPAIVTGPRSTATGPVIRAPCGSTTSPSSRVVALSL